MGYGKRGSESPNVRAGGKGTLWHCVVQYLHFLSKKPMTEKGTDWCPTSHSNWCQIWDEISNSRLAFSPLLHPHCLPTTDALLGGLLLLTYLSWVPHPTQCLSPFFFFFSFIVIYLFLAVLGLRCCMQAFSSCGERGLLFIALASLVMEHRI